MTELKTPQALLDEYYTSLADVPSCSALPPDIDVAFVRRVMQHTLEAAAKAVCMGCDEGWPFRDSPRVAHTHPAKDAWVYRCRAQGIWKLIPKDPAPADFETGESRCIHCASEDVVEDTSAGERPYGRAFRCTSCGERWLNADYPAPAETQPKGGGDNRA